MRVDVSLPPLHRSEAFAEDLPPQAPPEPRPARRGAAPLLLLMLSALVALAAGAVTVLVGTV